MHRFLPSMAVLGALCGGAALAAEPVPGCSAHSGAIVPHVVELYTSEGCSSCPPADRWLAGLRDRPDVVPLAFHVDYWDRLGWVDRHASPLWTRRQHEVVARAGARAVYTPQVLLDGRDYRGWPALPAAAEPARISLSLRRDGAAYVAEAARPDGAPAVLGELLAVPVMGTSARFVPASAPGSARRHVVFVVAEAATGRPLQALSLNC